MTGPPDAAKAPATGAPVQSSHARPEHTRAVRQTACICPACVSVDHLPTALLRSVSPLAEFVGRRLEVQGGAG